MHMYEIKVSDFKAKLTGIEDKPINVPKAKKKVDSRSSSKVDLNQSLAQKMSMEKNESFVGLNHITEFQSLSQPHLPRFYDCDLDGCKKA